MWSFFHYININEIPGDPSRENISSHLKIACYPIRKITFCCGYIMNRASVWPLGDIQGFTHLKIKIEIITLLLHFIAHITSFHWSIHTFEHLQMSTDYVVGRNHFWERYHRSLYHPDSSSHGLPQIQPVQKLTSHLFRNLELVRSQRTTKTFKRLIEIFFSNRSLEWL